MTAITAMFMIWKPLFKTKMKEAEWGLDTVKIWTLALTEMNITPDEFATAHKKSLSLDWQPTTPADFIKLARQDISNYPDMRQAYLSATEKKYPHVVVYETAKRVGFWEIKTQLENVTWKSWQEIYPKVCDEHKNGADFTLPESQQVTYERTVADSKTADDYLAQMFAVVGKEAVA